MERQSDVLGPLLDGAPVAWRRIEAAGMSTQVLESGSGSPIVLLHGPGEFAGKWLPTVAAMGPAHRLIAPDLPGHGDSPADPAELDADRVLAWLDDVIGQTCSEPPVLVGQILGGAIAARYAARHPGRLRALVLSDSLGLADFAPEPSFAAALAGFQANPGSGSFDTLWRYCAADLDTLRERLGQGWDRYKAYALGTVTGGAGAAMGALMGEFAMRAIPDSELATIGVPITLVWGRQDLAVPLRFGEAAAARLGWPVHVIDDCGDDPPFERPQEFARVLRHALAARAEVAA